MDIDEVVEAVMEEISETGDDTEKFTQAQSAEFYEGIAGQCSLRARLIREEMK